MKAPNLIALTASLLIAGTSVFALRSFDDRAVARQVARHRLPLRRAVPACESRIGVQPAVVVQLDRIDVGVDERHALITHGDVHRGAVDVL